MKGQGKAKGKAKAKGKRQKAKGKREERCASLFFKNPKQVCLSPDGGEAILPFAFCLCFCLGVSHVH